MLANLSALSQKWSGKKIVPTPGNKDVMTLDAVDEREILYIDPEPGVDCNRSLNDTFVARME